MAGLILLGMNKAVRVNLAMAHNGLESVRAHWLARAGLAKAMAVLADDDPAADNAWEAWYYDSDLLGEVELVGGTFSVVAPADPTSDPTEVRYGLVDHSSRLNVNAADRDQLKSLCHLADWQVDSILDWRDADGKTRPAGAEALYYRRLDYPYLIRNGPLQTSGELRLIRGIDTVAFAAEDANDNGVLDANENDLRESFPDDDGDGRLLLGLSGLTTVYSYEFNRDAAGSKRVNFNTVGKEKLKQRFDFTDALANAIAETRSDKRPKSKDPKAKSTRFNSLMDLLNVSPKKAKTEPGGDSDSDEDKVNKITVKWLAEHLDELTLTDEDRLVGKINVNTAPREVLLTLPKMNKLTADAICQRQTAGQGPFDSVGEMLTDGTISDDQFKAFAERVTVRSSVFEIRSSAVTKRGTRHKIIAVVDRGTNPMTILYWYQSE